jgi:DNA-binding LacI/PurR family transcriptional regulator
VLAYERPTKLRGKRARLVGMVLPELQNPIFPALAEVVGGALAQLHFTPVLCASGPKGMSEANYVNMLLDQHVSGVIFAGGNFAEAASTHDHYRLLRDRALPVVLVNASSDDVAFPQVSTDDTVATEQACNHLQVLGHENIAMILGPEDHMPSRLRLAAFQSFAARTGLSAKRVAHVTFSLEAGHAVGARLVGSGATGIVCASDLLALGTIRAVRRLGLRVPEDVSVVGYDDSALMMCTDPPLTTIRQPIEAMGRAAVKLLAGQIEASL